MSLEVLRRKADDDDDNHYYYLLTEEKGCAVVIRAVGTETFPRKFLHNFNTRCLQIRTVWLISYYKIH